MHPVPSPFRASAKAWSALPPDPSVAGTPTSFRTPFKVDSSERNSLTTQNQELPSPCLYQTDHFLLLSSDYEAQAASLFFIFVQLHLCSGHASPTRMSAGNLTVLLSAVTQAQCLAQCKAIC